ncbi:hypothetical protein KMZ14_05055 [Acinetobacter schindleri]|uniref:hypothetical protein n=1 Tax=Acinetobacter schindleri TaxID=108981 RepID=UPI00161C7EC9|nr:hypothetical protein [Acinetobacter schindleri]MBB4835445.1 RNA polymerase-interacting CarD/CdnL/TRCF family regulator [Acinetobacter schindleri]WDE16916.1 hypothetical protein KMZ14_05055 [Acinetobacter schindleri]
MSSMRKQKRINRYNINLTDSESDLFIAVSNLTGVNIGVILRQLALKQALATLIAEDVQEEFNLENYLNKGASDHLSRS